MSRGALQLASPLKGWGAPQTYTIKDGKQIAANVKDLYEQKRGGFLDPLMACYGVRELPLAALEGSPQQAAELLPACRR